MQASHPESMLVELISMEFVHADGELKVCPEVHLKTDEKWTELYSCEEDVTNACFMRSKLLDYKRDGH